MTCGEYPQARNQSISSMSGQAVDRLQPKARAGTEDTNARRVAEDVAAG
jgi:hypothetical protein